MANTTTNISEVQFTWKFTEQNWENLRNDLLPENFNSINISADYDFYGCVYAGNLSFDIQTSGNSADDRNIIWINVFQLHKDDGYAQKKGIPYALLDCFFEPPICENYEEFKEVFEQMARDMIEENELVKEAMNNKKGWEKIDG